MDVQKIVKIHKTDSKDFTVTVEFKDGFIGTVSLKHLFDPPKGVFKEVVEDKTFDQCFLVNGNINFPTKGDMELDLCSDALRMDIEEAS